MFRPNQYAKHFKRLGRNKHAEETFADPVDIAIAVVRLGQSLQKTTVRADSSASRGTAEEQVTDGVLLVDKAIEPVRDDRIELLGAGYRVVMVHPRFSVWGQLDHYEIEIQSAP